MAIRDIFKISRKTFFNPTAWIGYEYLKTEHNTIKSTVKNLFVIDKPTRKETFAAAIKRLDLTEERVQQIATTYRIYAILFAVIGFVVFFYAFYLLFRYSSIPSWFLGLAASALFFSQAFRYDFWAFQMRRRKLGVTFKEWKQHILGGEGKST